MEVSLILEGDAVLAKSWAEKFKIVIATVAPEVSGGHDVIRALAERAAACRSVTAMRRRSWPRQRSIADAPASPIFSMR
jgi:O-acetyl-ADP-ribose deacetylase (regulator of RNase III)